MKFVKVNDEEFELVFEDKEIEVINNFKKLIFTPKASRDLVNNLVNVAAEINKNLSEDVQNERTYSGEVKTNDKYRK